MSDSAQSSRPESSASLLRYLDGTLAPGEAVRLNEQLKADATLRRDFAELLLQEVHLGDLGREALAAVNAADEVPRPATPPSALGGLLAFPLPKRGPGKSRPTWNRWRRPFALAAGLIGLIGLAVSLFPATHNTPTLSLAPTATGTIERGPERLIARDQMILRPDDVLRLVGTNTATLSYGSEPTRVTLAAGTELKILAWTKGKRLELRQGRLDATVARQRPFRPMVLTTSQAEAQVLGTHFTLEATTNTTRLDVTEGKVRFTRRSDDVTVKLSAGNYAVAMADSELAALPFTGGIRREWWIGVGGKNGENLRDDPRYPDAPSGAELVPALELKPVSTNQMGIRYCGYVHPPVTGEYEFWLAGGPAATLSMSPGEDPTEIVPVARLEATTGNLDQPRGRGASPWAPPIPLMAGRRYYVEALVQIKSGEGHLLVAWKIPGREREPLTGEYLSPFIPK